MSSGVSGAPGPKKPMRRTVFIACALAAADSAATNKPLRRRRNARRCITKSPGRRPVAALAKDGPKEATPRTAWESIASACAGQPREGAFPEQLREATLGAGASTSRLVPPILRERCDASASLGRRLSATAEVRKGSRAAGGAPAPLPLHSVTRATVQAFVCQPSRLLGAGLHAPGKVSTSSLSRNLAAWRIDAPSP